MDETNKPEVKTTEVKMDRTKDLNRLLDLFNAVKVERGTYERDLMTEEFVAILKRLS